MPKQKITVVIESGMDPDDEAVNVIMSCDPPLKADAQATAAEIVAVRMLDAITNVGPSAETSVRRETENLVQ